MPIKQTLKRFAIPALVSAIVLLVFTIFFVGGKVLTEPEAQVNLLANALNEAKQGLQEKADGPDKAPETPKEATILPDGTFDFFKYQYYSFPLPFVANLRDGKATFTAEIAIATYGSTFVREKTLEQIETFNPKLRSKINLMLSDLTSNEVSSVANRKALEVRLFDEICNILFGSKIPTPNPVRAAYLTKFVIS